MPVIKTYVDKPEFELQSDNEYRKCKFFVFLSRNIIVQVVTEEDEDGDENETEHVYAILEHPSAGILYWDENNNCWVPDEEDIQKAYSDYIAEKELLTNPPPKKVKSNVRA